MPKKFLIGQLACYGDCLFATTIAKQIKYDYPDSHITWAIASKYKSILDHNPDIDKIWELAIPGNDFYGTSWNSFELEARMKKENGEFDEIIFSQITPLNWINYSGTIRETILSAYGKPITVFRDPVIQLGRSEEENVFQFAKRNSLNDFEHVILFECAPGSGQSKLTPQFALSIAQNIVSKYTNVCFILSSPNKMESYSTNVVDASELTFRENAALSHYCTLLIGCSSGITWLSTSTAAKKLPMIQLLNAKGDIFAGVHFDFEINEIDNSHVVEIVEYDEAKLEHILHEYFKNGITNVKAIYHQEYKPDFYYLKKCVSQLLYLKKSNADIFQMVKLYKKKAGTISINYPALFFHILTSKIKDSDNAIYLGVKKLIKSCLGNK